VAESNSDAPAPLWRGVWLVALGLLIGLGAATGFRLFGWRGVLGGGRTRVDQTAVVDRLRTVAKLVTTEAMMRDVVSYQNTFYGSTCPTPPASRFIRPTRPSR
jgi:hypothetical protein